MAEKAEFVLGANFGTPYGSGSQLIFIYYYIMQQLFCLPSRWVFFPLKYLVVRTPERSTVTLFPICCGHNNH
jgi:hypothetical protein